MGKNRTPRRLIMKSLSSSVAFLILFSILAQGQTVPRSPAHAVLFPSALTEVECEGGQSQCTHRDEIKGTWVFHGSLGSAQWANGAVAQVVIERFDAGGVDIRRIDLPDSSSYGLTAVYKGTLHGDRIDGTVVWSWNGHWNDRHPSGRWFATVQGVRQTPPPAAAIKIPTSLIECEVEQCAPGREGGCSWVFHGLQGESRCRNGAIAKLAVQQFNADGIIIRRTDLRKSHSYGLTAIYTGKLRGNRITGYATWSWPGHWNGHKPSGPWFATVQKESSRGLPPVPPPLISPDVHPDGRVTFRVLDPDSQEVVLDLEGAKPVVMQKNDLGVWSITTAPLRPDYYGYIFRDFDVPLIDPSNPLLLPNLLQTESMVHVPGPASLPWEIEDEPHGVVHHHFYKSAVIGDERDYYVYTPPGYDPRAKTEYPVLYLLHGFGQETSNWPDVGFANRILDHLIDEGKAKPMIVVMPDAYGGTQILAPGAFWNNAVRERSFNKFTEALLNEVIPQVQREYRVKEGRNSRALAGLSMGGAEALITGLNHLDEFAWIGAFSSGGLTGEDLQVPTGPSGKVTLTPDIAEQFDKEFPGLNASVNARLHLLWVACGTDDSLIAINRDFSKWLTSKGIRHINVETPGEHTWMVWRRDLANFAPLLFR